MDKYCQFCCRRCKIISRHSPNCTEALDFFDEFKKQRVQALKEYAKYYGPLTLDTATTQMDYWKWINDPWPWQEGGC